jgi:hypothetical protein
MQLLKSKRLTNESAPNKKRLSNLKPKPLPMLKQNLSNKLSLQKENKNKRN